MKKFHFASAMMMALISGSLMAQTIVTVNGSKIDSSKIDAQVKMLQAQSQGKVQDSPALRQRLVEQEVGMTVVGQEARRLKLDQSPEYKAAIAKARAAAKQSGADKSPNFKQEWASYEAQLQTEAYAHHILQQNPVTEAQIKAAYDNFVNTYKDTQEVQVGDLLTQSETDAQKAISVIKKSGFKAAARQYSLNNKAGNINLQYMRLKDLQTQAPEIYNAIKDLKKGGYSAPLQGNQGVYGVFYINDKRAVPIPAYNQETQNAIGQDLAASRVDQAIGALIQKATIKPAN